MIQTETNRDSCLRTLLWRRTTCIATLSIGCYRIANDWKASNLGFGHWLITAADDHYELIEPDEINTNQPNTVTKAGCRVFFITLGCGRVITGPNIKLHSDLTSCNSVPPVRLDFKIPDSLSTVFDLVPPLDDLPNFSSRTEAQTQLRDQVQPNRQFDKVHTNRS